MTPTPNKGGIFQFLTKLVAQTTLRHELLGHDLGFSPVPNTPQVVWFTIPSSDRNSLPLGHCYQLTSISCPPPLPKQTFL